MLIAAGVLRLCSRISPVLGRPPGSLAASGKVLPAILFGLFLLDGRYWALAVAISTMFGANLIAMLCMHAPLGTLIPQILANMDAAKGDFTSGVFRDRFNHSFFGTFRGSAFLTLRSGRAWYLMNFVSRIYTPTILASTGFILVLLRRASFTNRVLVLSAMMLAFPYVSGDYKLIHLYVPFGLVLIGVIRKGWASPAEVAVLLALTLLFSPKSYQLWLLYSVDFLINSFLLATLQL